MRFGVGIGPFSVSASDRDVAGCIPGLLWIVFVAFPIAVAVAWPYWLATYIAVEGFGVADPSTTRTVVGWVAEAPYLVILLALAFNWNAKQTQERTRRLAVTQSRTPSGSAAFTHEGCHVNHRTTEAASACAQRTVRRGR